MEKLKGKIRLFAAGGAGTNIVKQFEEYRGVEEPGRALFDAVYVDTSRSNLSAEIPESAIYLIKDLDKDLDGSGGVRRDNHKPIAERVKEILHLHPPLDLNIVVSSASGGSGSVIAPSIVSELLAEGHPVVVLLVGDTDTKQHLTNTVNTIRSYDKISELREVPVVAAYLENSKEMPREKVDGAAFRMISSLGYVYSRENTELDSRDLFNFLNFHRATDYKPHLAGLSLFWGAIPEEHTSGIISVATVASRGVDASLAFTPDYKCLGYFPADIDDAISKLGSIHLTTHSDKFSAVHRDLDAKLTGLAKANKARLAPAKIAGDNDDVTDAGLVF